MLLTDRPVAFLFYSTSLMNWFKSNKEFFLLFPHLYCVCFAVFLHPIFFSLYYYNIIFRRTPKHSMKFSFQSVLIKRIWDWVQWLSNEIHFFSLLLCALCTCIYGRNEKRNHLKWNHRLGIYSEKQKQYIA